MGSSMTDQKEKRKKKISFKLNETRINLLLMIRSLP